jgi:hypothetical protein
VRTADCRGEKVTIEGDPQEERPSCKEDILSQPDIDGEQLQLESRGGEL